LFREFLEKVPQSQLKPEIELAVARTFLQENEVAKALQLYEQICAQPLAEPLAVKAEFSHAMALATAGRTTNALQKFTNVIARFPSNELAFVSLNWVADYYWNQQDFINADKHYQLLFQNPAAPQQLALNARLMAGRAMYAVQLFNGARNYFTELVNLLKETNAPSQLKVEAWFGLADTIYMQFLSGTNKTSSDFDEAVSAYQAVLKLGTNNATVRALGRTGDLYLQWGLLKNRAESYEWASNAYQGVVSSPYADLETRALAQIALGTVAEKQNHHEEALKRYLLVLYEADEKPLDPHLIKEAGAAAIRVCENGGLWEQVESVCSRLGRLLPALQPAMDRKIAAARANLSKASTR
jgi:hypothetical protein